MIFVLVAINTLVFLFLSFLHIYWGFGGTWGLKNTLPVRVSGELALKPSKFGTVIVGMGLSLFAFITLANIGFADQLIDRRHIHTATYIIAGIFSLRAIGDFKYVGFMKSIKGTEFAKEDTRTYVPLCLVLSLFSLSIPLLTCVS
ncbi:DUF3995 domain-containing protein [Pedobacter antarcticus]|uniref:DUF3995 domain-containing protein n=1 Tax=Pedobacter antarcticus TaxID=34086 RepID=UPI00292DDCCD|nr:DUF3995 domain-containing protein [Pedobacter antarcticus]